ncbi:MAG: NAD-dependent succinate-semialdehyde dehydrogenase [Sphingomonas bacterium]|nr:NAD-dependent succinate-semialdehyde dehydrogenase [Sphingomonas bacterium]MDB5688875.1 NAD-dependent succinate-semialdehyde dehydrogenase [Sphingomonas bacterium]
MAEGYDTELKLFIDGEWIGAEGRDTHIVVNPATGEALGALPLANADDLDRALDAAARGFRIWRAAPADQKAAVLSGAARLLRERIDRVARIATMEEGKPLPEARGEVMMAANLFDFYAGEVKRIYGRVLVRPAGTLSRVMKEPVGPIAAFCPWNFPIGNPARKLGAAVGAGCSIVVKPPEEAPGSAIEVLKALLDAGLPKEVASMVFGVPDTVSRHLIASPVTRKVSFTGSVPVGKHLAKLAAEQMMRTTMELGGHGPVLVFDDADLDRTLDLLVPHKFRNSGQVCVSPTRFYVQEGIYDRFVREFAERAGKLKVGDGLDAASNMGPMANPRRPDAIEAFVEDAVKVGARVAAGGTRGGGTSDGGFFFRPTVLADVPLEARIMNEEPFGPIALMRPFKTFDEAIEQANRLPYGLAAYCFTENGRRALLLGDAIESGMIGINTVGIGGADSPFGGVKDSGHGSEDGPEGLEACLVTKAIHQA